MKNFLSNIWYNFKETWVDRTDTPLQASLQRSCNVDFAYLAIIAFIIQPTMLLLNMKGTVWFEYVEQFGFMWLAFTIADYCTYRRVKNFKEPKETK